MKIANWNVNSIRTTLDLFTGWLTQHELHILLLQELKGAECPDAMFKKLGYESVAVTQKAYNDVAIMAHLPIETINKVLAGDVLPRIVPDKFLVTAYRMEQVNAPARAYHKQMKRELPVTCCTELEALVTTEGRKQPLLQKPSGEDRCGGVNAITVKNLDWIECRHCQATGCYRNKECPQCKGAGYLFVGLRGKETVV